MEAADSSFYLKRFNQIIQQWIDSADSYTIDMLLQKPGDGSWSLGQVYMHIIDDTGYFTGQIKLALATRENIEKGMHEDAIAIFNWFCTIWGFRNFGCATNPYSSTRNRRMVFGSY